MPFWAFPQWFLIGLGLLSFLVAIALWDRTREQPDTATYSMDGIKSSKKEVQNTAIGLLIAGIFLVLLGLTM